MTKQRAKAERLAASSPARDASKMDVPRSKKRDRNARQGPAFSQAALIKPALIQAAPNQKGRRRGSANNEAKVRSLPALQTIPPQVTQPLPSARMRRRHLGVLLSFLVIVLIPVGVAAWYLWSRAADQYASHLGFTVRREESPSPTDFLGGLSNLSTSGSSDADILFEFVQSQELVRLVDASVDLRGQFAKPFAQDPVFALRPDPTIEELVNYWRRMVQASYTRGTGLIELRVLAFDPQDAQAIATAVLEESSRIINDLSAIARHDATSYAREDLEAAVAQLRQARQEMTRFRTRTQIVDPEADIQLQMGLINTLQQQLGEELISFDLLRDTTRENDPRVMQSERRIAALRARIAQERDKFGDGVVVDGQNYATLVAEYEGLAVALEFAQRRYTGALATFDQARAEAQRQSRYLAAFERPTLAESAEYPQRLLLMGLCALFLTIGWAVFTLIYYSLRDRR